MNARRESKERNLTWRIQEDRNYWTLLKHFLELNLCILYVVSKLGKSEIQRFKRPWFKAEMKKLEPLEADHTKLKANFASCEISLWLRNHKVIATRSAFGCEMEAFSLQNFAAHLTCLRNPPECFQIFATETFRFFSSDICCLNPYFLVIHQS